MTVNPNTFTQTKLLYYLRDVRPKHNIAQSCSAPPTIYDPLLLCEMHHVPSMHSTPLRFGKISHVQKIQRKSLNPVVDGSNSHKHNKHNTQHRSFSVEENHATKVQTQIHRLYTPGPVSLPPGVLLPHAPPPFLHRSFQMTNSPKQY